MKVLREKRVRDIILDNAAAASVLFHFGIDYCNENKSLEALCSQYGADVEQVEQQLQNILVYPGIRFSAWPLDLLLDYILKYHHRIGRQRGAELLRQITQVRECYGKYFPDLQEIYEQVVQSLSDLEIHFSKEENVLFPYLYELVEAAQHNRRLGAMHCGTICNPIRVMLMEHEGERQRYMSLRTLTRGFSVPNGVGEDYARMMFLLREFVESLFEHIFLENNLLFPHAEALEREWVN